MKRAVPVLEERQFEHIANGQTGRTACKMTYDIGS